MVDSTEIETEFTLNPLVQLSKGNIFSWFGNSTTSQCSLGCNKTSV